MKGKTILITAGCVLGFGGIIANTTVGIIEAKKLENDIATLRADAQQADEDYRKATVDQLTALVENTRSNLQAAFEAADASLQAGLNNTIAAVDQAIEEIADDVDEKDAAYAKAAADNLKALADATSEALDLLGSDIEGLQNFQTQAANKINAISNDISLLDGRLEAAEEALEEALDYIGYIANYVVYLENNLETLAGNLSTLQQNLANNYYRAEDVDLLVGNLNTSIQDIVSYFQVGTSYVSMEDLIDELTIKFNSIDDALNTFNTRVENLENSLTTLNEGWEDFNGEETTAAKADAIEELWTKINQTAGELEDIYNDIATAYAHQALPVPANVTNLYNTLHTAALEAAANNVNLYTAIAKIILAQNKDAVQDVLDSLVGDVEGDVDSLRFELDRVNASNAVYDLVSAGAAFDFNAYAFNYFNDIIYDFEYSLTGLTDAEKATYYEDLTDEVKFVVTQAKAYDRLRDGLDDLYSTIHDYANSVDTTRYTTEAQLADYVGALADLVDFDSYKTAIEQKVDNVLVLNSKDALDAFVNAILDDGEIIRYAADKYNELLKFEAAMEVALDNTDYVGVVDSADILTAYNNVIDEISETSYKAAMDAARIATDEEGELLTLAQRKEQIDKYVLSAEVDMKYETLCIQMIFNIATAAATADATIDGLTNVAATAENVVFKAAYADTEQKPDLAEVYLKTCKGAEGYFGNDEDLFELLESEYTEYISNIVKIAKNQEAIYVDTDATLTELSTIAGTTTIADAITAKANYVKVTDETFENYKYIVNNAIKGLGDGSLNDLVAQSTADLASVKANNDKAVAGYTALVAVANASEDFNANMASGIAVVKALFTIEYNNAAGDGATVLTEYADELDDLKDEYYIAHGVAVNTFEPFKWDDNAEYGANIEALNESTQELNTFLGAMDERRAEFNEDLASLKAEMIATYKEKEAARLESEIKKYAGEAKDGATGDLRELYAAVLALVAGDSAKTTTAAMYFDAALRAIQNAETSDLPEKAFNEIVANFITLIGDSSITTLQELLAAAATL